MNKKDNQSKPWGGPRCIITKMRPRDLRGGSDGSGFFGSTPICFSETDLIMRRQDNDQRQDVDEEWNTIQTRMDELLNSDVNERIVSTLQANSGTDLSAFIQQFRNSSQSFHEEFTKHSQAIADAAARPIGSDSSNTLVLHQGNVPPHQDNTNATYLSGNTFNELAAVLYESIPGSVELPLDVDDLSGLTVQSVAMLFINADFGEMKALRITILQSLVDQGLGQATLEDSSTLGGTITRQSGLPPIQAMTSPQHQVIAEISCFIGMIKDKIGLLETKFEQVRLALALARRRTRTLETEREEELRIIAEISRINGMITGKIDQLETTLKQTRLALALSQRRTRTLEAEKDKADREGAKQVAKLDIAYRLLRVFYNECKAQAQYRLVEAQTVTTLEAEVQQSGDDAEEANSERRRAETEAVEQQARIESLETEVMEQRTEGERKDETIEKLNEEINRLNQDRQRLQAEKEEAEIVVAAQINTIEEQDTTIAEQNTTIETLETAVAERDMTIRTLTQRRWLADAIAQARFEHLERGVAAQTATIETLEGQLEEVTVQARHWIRTLKQRRRLANSIAQVRIENLEREAAEQRAEVDHSTEEDAQVKTCCCVIS